MKEHLGSHLFFTQAATIGGRRRGWRQRLMGSTDGKLAMAGAASRTSNSARRGPGQRAGRRGNSRRGG